MTLTRRQALQLGTAAVASSALPFRAQAAPAPAVPPPIRLAVSTYSYWHFTPVKYPIEKVIEHAAALGFEGVEILHRQMENETPAYVNGLKKAAFRAGLSLPMLSIHQDFVHPDPAERKKAESAPPTSWVGPLSDVKATIVRSSRPSSRTRSRMRPTSRSMRVTMVA